MSDLFTCPQGHQWQAARDDASESGRQPAVCPVCSSLASTGAEGATPPTEDEMPPPPKPVAAMLADPAAGAPDAVRPVPGASQRHTPDGTRYAETGQGPQDAVAAEWPVVAGYQILDVLGRGGMGVVYRAKQVSLDRIVALKMVLSEGHLSPERVRRFRSEAEAAARLQHPNIVQIHEVGEQDGRPYFAQEFVDGGSLAQRLAGAPLPAHEAAQIVQTLAQAMHYAHHCGIVHRDLKPANVLLTADGVPKIADFGLAKRLDNGATQTASGALVGTPSYMAPEQAGA